MPTYIVICQEDASDEQIQNTKMRAIDQGGKITQEYALIKGFSVEFPDDAINALEADPNVVSIEKDVEVSTE